MKSRDLPLVFSHLQRRLTEKFSGQGVYPTQVAHDQDADPELASLARYTGVSGFVFLRLICPAILGPKLFHIVRGTSHLKKSAQCVLMADVKYVHSLSSLHRTLLSILTEHPEPRAHRTLTLIAKSLQGLANLVLFGTKESWMVPMNEFINVRKKNIHSLDLIAIECH